MDSHMSTVLPIAVAVSVMSVFTLASYFAGDWTSSSQNTPPKKRLRSGSLGGASANNIHMAESQNYLPSATRNGFASLQLGSDLSEVGIVLTNSSNRRRQSYSNINSRYPLTARLGHVVEAMDDLRQLQRDTETALEEQCRQTEMERQLRGRMEDSLKAESQLREEAEASIRLYKDALDKVRADGRSSASSSSEHNTRIKDCVTAITTLIADQGLSPESSEHMLQLLATLSREAERM